MAEATPFFWMPYTPENPAVFTPLEELPEDIQILYEYNPDLAIDMLAEAGYPDGFTTNLMVTAEPNEEAIAELAKAQWAKIGVELTIEPRDLITFRSRVYALPPVFTGAVLFGNPVANPVTIMPMYYKTAGYCNFGLYSNLELDEVIERMGATLDVAEQNRLAKECALIALYDAPVIPLYLVPVAIYWWPWVKNYTGEFSLHDWSPSALIPFMWLDQDLKAEMGF